MYLKKEFVIFIIIVFSFQLTTIIFFYLKSNFSLHIWELSVRSNNDHIAWSDTPELTIFCRIYSGKTLEFYNTFLVSYLLFWPYRAWLNSDLVVVLDKENSDDHQFGTILAHLPPFPLIKFEEHDWRSEDYARTIYSSFYAETYTQSNHIGIIDSDSIFVTTVTPEDLFLENKPRIYGINGCCSGSEEPIYEVLGAIPVATFRIQSGLPLIVKRKHFDDCRQHIIKHMNVRSFEEAFKLICSKYSLKHNQYDIIGHYLWHFKRDEYSWHIKNDINHQKLSRPMTTNLDVLRANKPLIGLTKHVSHDGKYSDLFFKVIYDYLCIGSHMMARECKL